MATGREKTAVVAGKTITRTHYQDKGIDYHSGTLADWMEAFFPKGVVFVGSPLDDMTVALILQSTVADTLDVIAVRGTDGLGHFIDFPGENAVPVPNTLGTTYSVGLKYAEVASGTTGEINPRLARPEHRYLMDEVGEVDEPNELSVVGPQLKVVVNSLFEESVDYSGRTVRCWLADRPKSIAENGVYEDCTVLFDGSNNYIMVSRSLDQREPSTTPGDYLVWAQGISVFRKSFKDLSDRETNPGYCFVGEYIGTGAGVQPDINTAPEGQAYYLPGLEGERLTRVAQTAVEFPDVLTDANGRFGLTGISSGVRITGGDVLQIGSVQYYVGQTDITVSSPDTYYLRAEVADNGQLEIYAETGSRTDAAGAGGGDSTKENVLLGKFTVPSTSPDTATGVIAYANKARLGASVTWKPDTQTASASGATVGNSTKVHSVALYWARWPGAIAVTSSEVRALQPDDHLRAKIAEPYFQEAGTVPSDVLTLSTVVLGLEESTPCRHWLTAFIGEPGVDQLGARYLQVDSSYDTLCMIQGISIGTTAVNGYSEFDMGDVYNPADVFVDQSVTPPALAEKYELTITDNDLSVAGTPQEISFDIESTKDDENHSAAFWVVWRGRKQKATCAITIATSPPSGTLTLAWDGSKGGVIEVMVAEESTPRSAGASTPIYGPFKDLSHKAKVTA